MSDELLNGLDRIAEGGLHDLRRLANEAAARIRALERLLKCARADVEYQSMVRGNNAYYQKLLSEIDGALK